MTTTVAARILVIEDDEPVRRLVAEALGGCGYEVDAVGGGAEALALLCAGPRPFDLVLSDVVMPGVCGSDLAEQLRAASPGIPILHMSGYTDEVIARHGIPPHGPGMIRKPFTPEALVDRVREALGGGPG